jgi:PIN like domain
MDAPQEKSKSQSSTNPADPLENLVFFVDRCLGKSLWRELRALGLNAEHKDDHFKQNTADAEWLITVGERGWVVLTRDTQIRRRPDEQEAIIKAGVRLFSLQTRRGEGGRRGISGVEMTAIYLKHLKKIQQMAVNHPAPFIAGVTRNDVQIMNMPGSKPKRRDNEKSRE